MRVVRAVALVMVMWCLWPAVTYSQINASGLAGLSLELTPRFPEPLATFEVRLNDYSIENAGGQVRWFVDGKELTDQTNRRSITLTAPLQGVRKNIEARVSGARATAAIVPRYVDLIVEPLTRVPNHYTGRALPSVGSTVNATAITGGLLSGELTYTWRIGSTVLFGGPVRGQNRVSFTMPQGAAFLEVTVARDGQVVGSQSTELMNTAPFLRFYPIHPLYGFSERPLQGRLPVIGASVTVRAEPYYLDIATFNSPNVADWVLDRRIQAIRGNSPYDITIARSETFTPSEVGFHVRNTTSLLQGARDEFRIE
jgi:hypothetical protein